MNICLDLFSKFNSKEEYHVEQFAANKNIHEKHKILTLQSRSKKKDYFNVKRHASYSLNSHKQYNKDKNLIHLNKDPSIHEYSASNLRKYEPCPQKNISFNQENINIINTNNTYVSFEIQRSPKQIHFHHEISQKNNDFRNASQRKQYFSLSKSFQKAINPIRSLNEVRTVQTKICYGDTIHKLEQSMIIYSGNEQKQQNIKSNKSSLLSNANQYNNYSSLIFIKELHMIYSVIKYCSEIYDRNKTEPSFLQIYYTHLHQRQQENQTFLYVCQPFQYTLEEKIESFKINTSNYQLQSFKICKFLNQLEKDGWFILNSFDVLKQIYFFDNQIKIFPSKNIIKASKLTQFDVLSRKRQILRMVIRNIEALLNFH